MLVECGRYDLSFISADIGNNMTTHGFRELIEPWKPHEYVEAGSVLDTDFLLPYKRLAGEYAHRVADHAVEVRPRKRVHSNGLENFWSLLKRGSAEHMSA